MGAHHILKDGTSYAIKGGTDLIAGTSYQIGGGRTLVDGTVYEVGFGDERQTWIIERYLKTYNQLDVNVEFTSNGEKYAQFKFSGNYYRVLRYDSLNVYEEGNWVHGEEYRTVIFAEPPTGALLAWLQANAVQQ